MEAEGIPDSAKEVPEKKYENATRSHIQTNFKSNPFKISPMVRIYRAHPDAKYRVAYGESQGIDLASVEEIVIPPQSRVLIPTGIHMAMPRGTFGFIKERSSIAVKKGLMTMAGIVDNSYRGEIKVVLFNTTSEPVKIEKGEFVAQILIIRVLEPDENLQEVSSMEELGQTRRGEGGFGSSGQ